MFELCIKNNVAKLERGQIQDWANPVFTKVFRSLPDIRSGKQIFFTSPNKNLPDRIKRADLVKKTKAKKLFYHHFYCIVLKTIHINKS